ncbi:MAG: hypothetical protein Q9222_001956 [Ikaeria aurantiellina]
MATPEERSVTFARIHPDGREAERALQLVAESNNLHPHHSSFIHAEVRTDPDTSGSDANPPETHGEHKRERRNFFFQLSLHDPVHPYSRGWVAGRGSEDLRATGGDGGVDLLFISPESAKTSHVSPMHVGFWIHPRSGALMLRGAQDHRPIKYKVTSYSPWVFLRNGESHVMFQRTNAFSVGHLQFTLVFRMFDPLSYQTFVEKRNASLIRHGFQAPRNELSAVPRPADVRRGHVLTQAVIAKGASGWVRAAVDIVTGQPLAVKEQRPEQQWQMEAMTQEFNIGRFFSVSSPKSWKMHSLTRR